MTGPQLTRRSLLRNAGLAAGGVAALGTGLWTPASAAGKSGPLMTCYVEVNSNSIANVGKYVLSTTGATVFDIGIIFAANINYDGTKAVLYNNPQVQATLDNAATLIRPLQAQGIKVLLSVLGNHQGAGICNFPDYAAADAFAAQVADTVYAYGLDGVDFDDEYADYGANGTGQPNAWSFVYLCQALRARMPDKIVSLYWYGPVESYVQYGGDSAGNYLDYSWNGLYGQYIVPAIPGMTKAQLAPAAVSINSTSTLTAKNLASRTLRDGYGVYNTYNLTATNAASYLSSITKTLYGSNTSYTG